MHGLRQGERAAMLVDDGPCCVVGRGGDPQAEGPRIALGLVVQEAEEARGSSQQKDQEARGRGIERARVADPRLSEEASRSGHKVVAGGARLLVQAEGAFGSHSSGSFSCS
jgi:hypothetical protein